MNNYSYWNGTNGGISFQPSIAQLQKQVELLEKVIRSSPELNREYEKLMMVEVLIGDEK